MTDLQKALRESFLEKRDYQINKYEPDPTKEFIYVLQRDGIYGVHENKLAKFTFKLGAAELPELNTVVSEGVELKIPKIPYEMYDQLVEFYKHVYDEHKSEVYAVIYYCPEEDRFFFVVPKQEVSGASVKWDPNDMNEYNEKYIKVLETHSHNNMNGSFSGIDDTNHQEFGVLHMVIGTIFGNPSYSIRYSHGNKKVTVKMDEIFNVPAKSKSYDFEDLFPEYKERITSRKHTAFKYDYSRDKDWYNNVSWHNPAGIGSKAQHYDKRNPLDIYEELYNKDAEVGLNDADEAYIEYTRFLKEGIK